MLFSVVQALLGRNDSDKSTRRRAVRRFVLTSLVSALCFLPAAVTRATDPVPPTPAPNPPFLAQDMAVSGDGSVRIFMQRGTSFRIQKQSGTTMQIGRTFTVSTAWSLVGIAAGKEGTTSVLWQYTDGQIVILNLDAYGTLLNYQAYGPYTGWRAEDIACAGDGSVRILMVNGTSVRIQKILGTALQIGKVYVVSTSWTPEAIAAAPDGTTRVLFNYTDGRFAAWILNADGVLLSYRDFARTGDWKAGGFAISADGSTRFLMLSGVSVRIQKWSADVMQVGPTYAGGSPWSPVGLGAAGEGTSRLVWRNTDGRVVVWSMSPTGVLGVYTAFGPYR